MLTTARLLDLDEAVLRVRDANSRLYIGEAVAAYRAGANRSAIIAAWIAVVTDIIAKIKELANQSDANAQAFVRELDVAVAANDLRTLQTIEQAILNKAEREFEFLSAREAVDLERLKADRHLCAHPAFVSEDSLYQPSADLVRTHIVHAVEHLLAQQPVQGRSALERIKQDLRRSTFPLDEANAKRYLIEKYLRRAKPVLLRNLVIVVVKEYLRATDPDLTGRERELITTLRAVAETNHALYEQTMAALLPREVADLDEPGLLRIFRLLGADSRCWQWIGEAERIRATALLHSQSSKQIFDHGAFAAIGVAELHEFLIERLSEPDAARKTLNARQVSQVIAEDPRPEFTALAVTIYQRAGSYDTAGVVGANAVLPLARFFSAREVEIMLEAAWLNEQIRVSSYSPKILAQLFAETFDRLPETKQSWLEFITQIRSLYGETDYYSYPELFGLMQEKGLFDE